MSHCNTQFTGHMNEADTDQQANSHPHPEPWLYYENLPAYPHPNFSFHHVPEHHDNALLYRIPHYNAMPPQHNTSTNSGLYVGAQSTGYTPYLAPHPSSTIRDFPFQGTHEQFSLYHQNVHYMNDVNGAYQRKRANGPHANFQYLTTSVGPSSSVNPMTARPAEPEIVRPDSVMAHNGGHVVQRSYVASPVQFHGNRLVDSHFGAINGDVSTFSWMPALNFPNMHGNMNAACLENGNMGIMQGYQITSNRNATGFMRSPIPQGHPFNPPHPTQQGMRGYCVSFPPQVSTPSHRIPSGSSNIQNVPEAGLTFLAPEMLTGFRMQGHHRRELTVDSNSRNCNLHLRVLPEDEVAILEIPGYYEVRDSMVQHRDMRLDIDHMSYEELLALEEHIGSVGTGLSEDFIQNYLKTRTLTSPVACVNLNEATSHVHQNDFCVICQTDYEDGETVGTLDCGHEYHRECVKKWLKIKNTCPVCKSTALKDKGKNL